MASILGRFVQQPNEVIDYDVDYTEWFSNRADTALLAVVVADAGINVDTYSLTGKVVRIVVSGGVSGQKYKVTTRLTTSAGVVKEADFLVTIKSV